MKTIKYLLTVMLMVLFGIYATAQTQDSKQSSASKTEALKVRGQCGMCKTRIENAVKSEGATAATWDNKTKMLTVTFDPEKTSLDSFGKKLASVGHDTEKYKAPDDVYAKLPGCCHYERGK